MRQVAERTLLALTFILQHHREQHPIGRLHHPKWREYHRRKLRQCLARAPNAPQVDFRLGDPPREFDQVRASRLIHDRARYAFALGVGARFTLHRSREAMKARIQLCHGLARLAARPRALALTSPIGGALAIAGHALPSSAPLAASATVVEGASLARRTHIANPSRRRSIC